MLFAARFWPGLADGSITVTFRRWRSARARVGSAHKVPGGMVVVDSVAVVDPSALPEKDAIRAGFESRAELLAAVGAHEGDLYRVEFHWAGPDPRVELRTRTPVAGEKEQILAKLARFDTASRRGPWTSATLLAIGQFPGTRAADLATSLDCDLKVFKTDVRKLKELGLTESLEVGYRLSPRGRALLSSLPPPPPAH